MYYRGSMQSIAFGLASTRSLTLLVSAELSYVADKIERYEEGYSSERGGTEQSVSAELHYLFVPGKRVFPYVLGGTGRGISRPNVAVFPDKKSAASRCSTTVGACAFRSGHGSTRSSIRGSSWPSKPSPTISASIYPCVPGRLALLSACGVAELPVSSSRRSALR